MTVSTINSRISYLGDGMTTVFAFPYKFIAQTDIKVYIGAVLQSSGYTVGAPSDSGANVTFTVAPAANASIVLLNDPDLMQSSALPSTGAFPSLTVEGMSDKLTLIAQRIRDLVSRSFSLPDSYSGNASTVIPTPEAGKIVAWNATATGLQNVDPNTLATVIAYGSSNADIFSGDGLTTAFTLSSNPGSQSNLDVSVSGVTQRPGLDYSWIAGTTLTFVVAPPSGTNNILVRYNQALLQGYSDSGSSTFVQSGTGAVTRNAQVKLREHVSAEDFGAVGDGSADDTAAIQNALNAGKHVELTSSIYKVGQLTIPTTCVEFFSKNGAKFIPAASLPSGATSANWVAATSATGLRVSGIWLSATRATYPNLTCFYFMSCTDLMVERNKVSEAGKVGIYAGNCTNTTIRNNKVLTASQTGIRCEGSSQKSVTVTGNYVDGTTTAHCISFQLGDYLKAMGNTCLNAGTFGISAYQVTDCIIHGNDTYNTVREGINTEDSSLVSIVGNTCRWPSTGSNSTDMGISIYGNVGQAQYITVADNTIINPAASGIGVAGSGAIGASYCNITCNNVVNANRLGTANYCGIILYGTGTQKNNVSNNVVTDAVSPKHQYGIGEINLGTGAPTNNTIVNNRITGFVTADIFTTNSTTAIGLNDLDMSGFRAYIPTVASTGGALTTASATGYYMRIGKIVFFYARATITNNGTGSGAINIGLPFIAVRGGGCGKELALTGKSLTFDVAAASTVTVRNYDNTYPGGTGAILDINGMIQIQ